MIDNLFTTTVGSRLWRMENEFSDTDLFRVYVASTKDILMGTANLKSKFIQKENTDIAYHEVSKVINQLLKGNLNFLIGVMSPSIDKYIPLSYLEYFYDLRRIVQENVSKNCYYSIKGLAKHNYKKYILNNKDTSQKRCKKIIRVLEFGRELLSSQRFVFKPIKYGTPEDIVESINLLDEEFKNSNLPLMPNEKPFRNWLYDIRVFESEVSKRKTTNRLLRKIVKKRLEAEKKG